MNITKEVSNSLADAGISRGCSILVHSSFKSLGINGREAPDQIIEGLLTAVGGEGNVLFPALSYEHVTRANPVFDVIKTKSCVGFLPEYFRINHATCRSLNPTHSVSGKGKNVARLLDGHISDDSPLGANSPYRRLKDEKGKIVMIGCGLRPNTFMHAVEEYAAPEYARCGILEYKIIDRKNNVILKKMHTHALRHFSFYPTYERIAEIMPGDALVKTRVLGAETYVISADILWETAVETMKKNPGVFADKIQRVSPPHNNGSTVEKSCPGE